MTSPALPDSQVLFAWHRRFSDRVHLWAGHLRLWTVELPIRALATERPLAEWVAKAVAQGLVSPDHVARKLGLPEAVVRVALRPVRKTFTFLELPSGPQMVAPAAQESWATPISISAADVPPAVLSPPGVDIVPLGDDWRTVPFVRAAVLAIAAVRRGEGIEVYAADPTWNIEPEPNWRLPANSIVPDLPSPIDAATPVVEQWIWSGGGSLGEAVLLRPQ